MTTHILKLSAILILAASSAHAINTIPTTVGDPSDISAFNSADGEYEGWENLNSSNTDIAGYGGSYPGYTAWPDAIDSNTSGSTGNGAYNKTAGAGYVGNTSIYSSDTGSFSISSSVDSLDDVNTVIFQFDAGLQDDWTNYVATLSYNGGSQSLTADYTALTNGSFTNEFGGETIYSSNILFQWDLSSIGDTISEYVISYDVAAHTQTYALQLDSSEAILSGSVIPEPSSFALLAGLVAFTGCATRRRHLK
ncbi:hypothetical protein SH580_07570 [Coraliomargarita algicola]|uniref:PEP-CTERM protein-sorting domain-containing protein n=1 Tax=Coraliomargarita algicola TaxID=3092156 RepID=A0ABZ0RR27_9BACT|nr:hypothetical protein [Coraliomargarita sp. J2-16]WPJ97566.1 hypothetical protein SH580_07570 [Coraliomargarita sp. J2-16]